MTMKTERKIRAKKGTDFNPKLVKVLGVDPGVTGAVVLLSSSADLMFCQSMPLETTGKERQVSFLGFTEMLSVLRSIHGFVPIFLERAIPMAMGSKSAFNYGRGFESLVISISQAQFPVTFVDPHVWTKEMHEGISADLKPKAKSVVAVKRLFPNLVGSLPQKPKGGLADGPIDALLIAAYGLRRLSGSRPVMPDPVEDFY